MIMSYVGTNVESPMQSNWEHFPHQADMGVRGIGPTKEAAFEGIYGPGSDQYPKQECFLSLYRALGNSSTSTTAVAPLKYEEWEPYRAKPE